MKISVYTDGSCHTQFLTGVWAAILFIGDDKITLKGIEELTTHNRMELLAVINAINYVEELNLHPDVTRIYSDSQYVVNLSSRMKKLKQNDFITKGGKLLQNADLLRVLIKQIETHTLEFVKVKAHQNDGDPINKEVDLLVRSLLRDKIKDGQGTAIK